MAQVLRDYAADPAPSEPVPDDPRLEDQDFGNIVAFEHINLEVPDLEVARLFYSEVLGLTQDPSMAGSQRGGANVTWYNVGRQQLHIAKGPVAQVLPPGAAIGLVLPHVDSIPQQAAALRQELESVTVTLVAPGHLCVTSPEGVVFHVHNSLKGFHSDTGIAYVHLPCFVGTSGMIGRFYGHMLGAPIKLRGVPSDSRDIVPSCSFDPEPGSVASTGGADANDERLPLSDRVVPPAVVPKPPGNMSPAGPNRRGPPAPAPRTNGATPIVDVSSRTRAVVRMGPGTDLTFYEEPGLGSWSTQGALSLFSGWHMAFYVSQFSPCYVRLRGLVFNTHPYRDKVHRFSDALHHHQFRFQDIVLLPDNLRPTLQLEPAPPSTQLATTGNGAHQITATGHGAGAAEGGAPQAQQAALVPKANWSIEPIASIVVTGAADEVSERGAPVRVGSLLYRISHEVRSLAHPNLLRPLFNRGMGFR